MAVCSVCGKKIQVGNNISFSYRHTKRKFRANLQNVRVFNEDGTTERKVMCTQCIKAMYKTTGRRVRAVPGKSEATPTT